MAISIAWGTKVINIPKADLTLIQASPIEIRELNLNEFRLVLKDLEDGEEGMPHLDTHRHNTEVTLGGLTFARVIEIINGYTITFEDGQYAVNLVGANSNVGDVVNVNQASVRSYNSAGLISNPAIEYSSFQNGVWIDATSSTTGTIYNAGTPENPVNNLADAKLIADYRGFRKIYIIGDFTFEATDNIDGYEIQGENDQHTSVTLITGCSAIDARFDDVYISGAITGDNCCFHNCEIGTLVGLQGSLWHCILSGNITLAGTSSDLIMMIECYLGTAAIGLIEVDMNGDGPALGMRAYTGGVRIKNKSGDSKVAIDFVSGRLEIMNTVTAGTFFVRGVGEITSNQGTGIIIYDDPLTQTIKNAVDTIDANVLSILSDTGFIKDIEGGKWEISGSQMIFYKSDNMTEIARFDITYDDDSNPIMRVRV